MPKSGSICFPENILIFDQKKDNNDWKICPNFYNFGKIYFYNNILEIIF